jgi:NAD(P)-dependent dehydrogenase (short-subunit alcohol dehydrogenase family)
MPALRRRALLDASLQVLVTGGAQGRVDVLVQAAGITGKTGIKTAEVDPANWDAVMAVNARGIFLGCRAVLPAMVKADYGRIVNIASVAGKEGNAGMAPYSASKGAVIALTKSVGKEYAETGEGRVAASSASVCPRPFR